MLCHGTVCVVGKIRDLILQLSKSSIYSTKPTGTKLSSKLKRPACFLPTVQCFDPGQKWRSIELIMRACSP
ncbi:hypothetical protein E8E50_12570 [Escherichia coli]|nr:hypothetical protein [Escherichia coli]